MPKQSHLPGNQAPTNVMQLARDHGIIAVRRPIAVMSHPLLLAIMEQLVPVLGGSARLFEESGLGVTVVGFTRFDRNHRAKGPRTANIAKTVRSAGNALQITIQGLGIYGSGRKHKLGLIINSDELVEEVHDFEAAFQDAEFPLKRDVNAVGEDMSPHCSIALLYEDYAGYFSEPTLLGRLGQLVLEVADGQAIMLEPVASI